MSSLRSRFKGPDAEQRFLEQREKARARAREHTRRKRSTDARYQRLHAFYLEMAAQYGDHCAICGGQPTNGRRLAIDHCHVTDEIRGLLCNKCNLLIGHAKDSVDILKAAIAYLTRDAYTGRYFAEVVSTSEEAA